MAGPIAATGAISNPTRYGALEMAGEQFTGLWTQAGPYRDAATPYLTRKFYQGNRFDRIFDGLNREITSDLTDGRRPGSVIYNGNACPPVNSYFSWKFIQDGLEQIRVLADCTDGTIRDVTAGQLSTVATKTAGASPARFMNISQELFAGDGIDQQKVMTGKVTWQANTAIAPGTLIATGTPSTMQMALGGISLDVVATASTGLVVTVWIDPNKVPLQFANMWGVNVTFSGLTVATFLNGNTYPVAIRSTTLGIIQITLAQPAYNETLDTGTGTTGTGITGGVRPSFGTTPYALLTGDGGQQWKCYGPALQNWGLVAPTSSPTITWQFGSGWVANNPVAYLFPVLDANQNVQVALFATIPGPLKTGKAYPTWTVVTTANPNPQTVDGTIIWTNMGKIGVWTAATAYATFAVILDSNQNLQFTTVAGASGAAEPTWGTTLGALTTDGAITWTCLGPGLIVTTDSVQYAFSTHAIDGSVSTASPRLIIQGPILGVTGATVQQPEAVFRLNGFFTPDTQLDQLWIYRTPQGQSILIFEDAFPMDGFYAGGQFAVFEYGIPDVSSNGNAALNAFIQAPVSHLNDPPPAGITGPVYHLQRTWAFVGNSVYYSAGPDTIPTTSNGNTAWPPLNRIAFQAGVIKLLPITVQNGGLLVFTTSGIFIVLGTGTASNPFYATQYCDKVNLASYTTLDVVGTEIYMMEANAKVSSLLVEYPFNPQSGYTEVGFPIGDQFKKVTTGGITTVLYNPATSYLSWNVQGSGETAMYVADGATGWFRMNQVSPPESGLLWHPRAAIAGGTSAVQSVETSPGTFDLLIGPSAGGGPILKRDTSEAVWDDNSVAYPSWDVKGVNRLCSTGQWAEVAHIASKSRAVGARPVVSVLLGEISASTERPWNVLEVTSPDPPLTRRSQSVYSDRYSLAQNGVDDTGDCILTRFDYGLQAVGDELYDWGIFASTEEERKEEVQKG